VTATELVFANGRLTVSGTVVTVAASNTIYSGVGAPANSLGIDGDFYFDEEDFFFYGPKVAGAWADEYVIMSGSAGAASQVTSVSSSSVAIETGSKIFTIPTSANRGWIVGMRLRAAFDSNNYVEGPITALASTTVTINVDLAVGSGTRTSWNIGIAGDRGATGAAGSNGSNGATGATGAAGPNSVSSSTATTLSGLLAGDGALVSVATIGAGLQFSANTLQVVDVVSTNAQTLSISQIRQMRTNVMKGSSGTITYTGGLVSSITYLDGTTATFTYSSGLLSQLDYTVGTRTLRKNFSYTNKTLASITETFL
jgi:hypothetical protein